MEAAAMTARVLPFRQRADVDDTVTAIFEALAHCRGIDIEIVCRGFRDKHAHLQPADLAAGFALARKVLDVLQRHLGRVAADDSSGGAA
jgi:hypothetical protein